MSTTETTKNGARAIEQKPDAIAQKIEEYVNSGQIAGAATLVWRGGAVVHRSAVGRRDLETGARMTPDTLFRIASLTKPITAMAALTLLEEGRFGLDTPITQVAPELTHMRVLRDPEGPLDHTVPAARAITFGDLLTHRAGLTYGDFHAGPMGHACKDALGAQLDNTLTPDEWIARLATLPLIDQPGHGFHYGVSTDLLGFLLARLEHTTLGELLARRIFAPLGMRDTTFSPTHAQRARCAGLCGFDDAGTPAPLSVAPGGHALKARPASMTYESGGQGLWSTLDDYLAFARVFIGSGAVDGTRVLRPEMVAMMTSNQLTPEQRQAARLLGQPTFAQGHGYGMGVAVVTGPTSASALQCRGGLGTVGWPGAYGSWWQADPTDGSVLIFMSHNMVELDQMARGVGLDVWGAILDFHALAISHR